MSLEKIFEREGVKGMVLPKLDKYNLPFSRKSIEKLVTLGEIIKPQIIKSFDSESENNYIACVLKNIGDKIILLPIEYEIIPMSPIKQRKKGSTLKFKRYSESQVLYYHLTPRQMFIESLSNIELSKSYTGYEWQGTLYTEKEFKVVPLVEIIQACKIFFNSKETKILSEKIEIEHKIYYGDGRYAFANVLVPSVSKKNTEKRSVNLRRIPIKRKNSLNERVSWLNISVSSLCPEHDWQFHFGRYYGGRFRKGSEKIFCGHEIAAYFYLINYMKNSGGDYVIAHNPFFVPNEELYKIYKVLTNQVMKEVLVDNGKTALSILNNAEIESMLWLSIAHDAMTKKKEERGSYLFTKYFNTKDGSFYTNSYIKT